MDFTNPGGAFALVGVVILIIIYLIRPKPRDMVIPSLMFIIRDFGITKKKSFLEKLLRNLIFILQMIAVAGLALSVMQPSMKTKYDTTAENTVIVLDVSASMQAESRFNRAVNTAEDSLKGDISIILAEETPIMILDKGSKSKAKAILSGIKPKDVTTNIGDAMLLAKDVLDGQEGRVLVISDFLQTHGPDPNVVRKILEANKAVVDMVNVAGNPSQGNLGIVDLVIEKHNTVVYIKNFNDVEKTATITVVNNNKEIKKISKIFLANSVDTISFETPGGSTEVDIVDRDDLDVDNKAYISAPDNIEIKVLVVTNRLNTYLKYAIESSKDLRLTTAEPPIVPETAEFDVVIFSNIDKSKLLTGTIDEIRKNVLGGKQFIIMAQDNLPQIDFKDMMPVYLLELRDKENAKVYPFAEANEQRYGFAEEQAIDYGTTLKYFTTTPKNSSVVYAVAGDSPVIASMKEGAGNVVYYGIFDESSSFKSSPSYPIFWNDLINSLMGTDDISRFNYQTGKMISTGSDIEVDTPEGKLKASSILMDTAGIYRIGSLKLAANLLSEAESDIYQGANIKTARSDSYKAGKVQRTKDTNLEIYLLVLVLMAMLAEIGYVKYTGEL